MIDFHRKRNFGDLISDTFKFLKLYGANYFKNYFIINGLLLILLTVLFILGYREFFIKWFGMSNNSQNYLFQNYFEDNAIVLIIVMLVMFLLFILFSVINYSYPVFYMIRVGKNPHSQIKPDDILTDLKANFGRLLIVFLGLTFIVSPIALLLFGISYLLVFILIGIPILMIIVPTITNVVNFIFYHSLDQKKGFFDSLSSSIRAQFSYSNSSHGNPYWKYLGSTLIISMLIQIISFIFSMIPMILLFSITFSNPESIQNFEQSNPFEGTFGLIFFVLYGVSIVVSLISANLLSINAGFLYFDSRTDLHRVKDLEQINRIGQQNV